MIVNDSSDHRGAGTPTPHTQSPLVMLRTTRIIRTHTKWRSRRLRPPGHDVTPRLTDPRGLVRRPTSHLPRHTTPARASLRSSQTRANPYEYESEQVPRSLLRRRHGRPLGRLHPTISTRHGQDRLPLCWRACSLAPLFPPPKSSQKTGIQCIFVARRAAVASCLSAPSWSDCPPPQPPCWDPARPPFGDAVAQSTPL